VIAQVDLNAGNVSDLQHAPATAIAARKKHRAGQAEGDRCRSRQKCGEEFHGITFTIARRDSAGKRRRVISLSGTQYPVVGGQQSRRRFHSSTWGACASSTSRKIQALRGSGIPGLENREPFSPHYGAVTVTVVGGRLLVVPLQV
jgi:hypothetical protein